MKLDREEKSEDEDVAKVMGCRGRANMERNEKLRN